LTKMYVGRIVIAGKNLGRSYVAYRVSSRSFPNRRAEIRGRSILVSPLNPEDLAKSPYIAYNCIRVLDRTAVVANGSHCDMILERIENGMRPLDAISLSLVAYGYERDELDTPRIAGVVHGDRAYLGIAKKDEFRVKEFDLMDGQSFISRASISQVRVQRRLPAPPLNCPSRGRYVQQLPSHFPKKQRRKARDSSWQFTIQFSGI
jgi:IMP cyclohydrolase